MNYGVNGCIIIILDKKSLDNFEETQMSHDLGFFSSHKTLKKCVANGGVKLSMFVICFA